MKIDGLPMSEQLRMMKGVGGIAPIKGNSNEAPEKSNGMSFGDFLAKEVEEVNQKGLESDKAIQGILTGEEANPHTALLAVSEAEISFRLMMTIKEKIEQAYQQIIRTQI